MAAGRSLILFSRGRKGPREEGSWMLKTDKIHNKGESLETGDQIQTALTILSLIADEETFFIKKILFFLFFGNVQPVGS